MENMISPRLHRQVSAMSTLSDICNTIDKYGDYGDAGARFLAAFLSFCDDNCHGDGELLFDDVMDLAYGLSYDNILDRVSLNSDTAEKLGFESFFWEYGQENQDDEAHVWVMKTRAITVVVSTPAIDKQELEESQAGGW